ncbi:MAG: glycosyltransferase family 2 protein [Verrucomicrobia bacterium]|nr:glycosyltransferase family 2 protein [Verrucomicrobiota bacterium]MCH8510546.1 glycosyltransferase family 2 protein [Kiritimatiellia bacterium]
MNRPKISACVMTFNEEKNIRRCLESLTFCDEIVVLDSCSTDATIPICREYTEHVFQEEWKGYITQRNRLRELANFDWVLFLDADEEVSPMLRDQILYQFRTATGKYMGFEFPRQVFYLGKWIRHGEWNPDIKLRLFRKDKGHSGGQEPHDMVIVDGPVKTLTGKLWHYTYRDLSHHIQVINHFSSISAKEMYRSGRRFGLVHLLLRPPMRFIKGYFIKAGFLDGLRGFIIAVVVAYGVAMKYAKLWECEWEAIMDRESRSEAP